MTNQSAREEALKRKYPVGTKGKLSPTKAQPLTHLLSAGWEPHFVLTVERAYVSTSSIDCLVLRWGQGRYDWAKVMTEGFEAIAVVSEQTGIEKWFEEGRKAALRGKGDGRRCPYDDDYHWANEYLWWNRGYRFEDHWTRLFEAEQLIEELKGDRPQEDSHLPR